MDAQITTSSETGKWETRELRPSVEVEPSAPVSAVNPVRRGSSQSLRIRSLPRDAQYRLNERDREMGRGLWKLHHAAQTLQAKRDFAALANQAINAGRAPLVKKHFYPVGAGWKTIDKHIAKLRDALSAEKESQ